MSRIANILIASVFVFVSSVSFSARADSEELMRLATSLCESAKNDDRSSMRKKLGAAKIRLKSIYDAIQCGSEGSLLRVATNSGAINAAKYIATKISKDSITKPESDGKNIIQFTQELVVAGDNTKQPFVELFQSRI